MVGSAILRCLDSQGYSNLVMRSREALDLVRQADVEEFFKEAHVEVVILAAARVGGIEANNHYPADFIYDNLAMECNVIRAAQRSGVGKLLFLGSSCIYPRLAPQPIPEEALLQGDLEATNEPYAVAKIAGIKLCESCNRQYGTDYRSVMPTNLYGPGDNFHPENAHVIPALMRRFHEAKERGHRRVIVWGSGSPRREFLHVDDMAKACVHVLGLEPEVYWKHVKAMQSHVNVGSGVDCSIRGLAETMKEVTGFRGDVMFDDAKPDGTPRKLLDISRIGRMGWSPSIPLRQGLESTYRWYRENIETVRQ